MELNQVGSTNVVALEQALLGDAGRLWITATEQTAGKGRRGRTWDSLEGNLFASLLLIDPSPSAALATLPLVASLALYKGLVTARPKLSEQLKIKWPNDLLLGGNKISGILLEASRTTQGRLSVVIGLGVNCSYSPESPLYPATSLKEFGCPITGEELFPHVARAMADELRVWASGSGFAIIRKEWLERAMGIGTQITARFSDHEMVGKFIDINADGLLLLEDENNIQHKISAADIFFGNSNSIGA